MLYAGVNLCKCEYEFTPAYKCEFYSHFYASVNTIPKYVSDFGTK